MSIFDLPRRKRQIQELEELTLQPNFWTDRNRAQNTSQKLAELKKSCGAFEALAGDIHDTADLLELADTEHDITMFDQLLTHLDPLQKRLDGLELTTFLSEEYDSSDCYIAIKPGAGGTESSDWASMLYRMYCRWLERNEFKYEVMDLQEEEQGIKSVTLLVKGTYAYGYLKGEKGVHRLVRISPFDSNARRHTSFTAVDVTPVLPDDADIEVRDE
ncbi:MAG TPA: PCRF domain-containing protein, partial [Candidatus Ozemobacteraceae bacterium]|nr:PCRF domain-containing protein [Candidatus Ozemobacteraceae bacterium]